MSRPALSGARRPQTGGAPMSRPSLVRELVRQLVRELIRRLVDVARAAHGGGRFALAHAVAASMLSVLTATSFARAQASTEEASTEDASAEEVRASDASPSREARAQALYASGVDAFADDRYDDALAHFIAAYELVRLPAFLFNQASSLDRLGRGREAITRYEAFLLAEPDATNRAYVESRLTLLRAERDDTTNGAGDVEGSSETRGAPLEAPPDSPTRRRSWTGPLVLFGVALGAAGASLGTGLRALSLRSDLDATCEGGVCPATEAMNGDRMARFALTTDVLFGVAGAAALGGLLWLLLGGSSDDTPPVTARCGATGCDARLHLRF